MGSSGSVLGKKRLNMNMQYFGLFLFVVVNGAPKPDPKPSPKATPNPNSNPKPIPKPDPKAKAQMALIFNNKKGHGDNMFTGESGGEEINIGRIDNIVGDINYSDDATFHIGSIGTHIGGINYIDSTGDIYPVYDDIFPRGHRHLGGTYPVNCNGRIRRSYCRNKRCYITCGDGRKYVIFCPTESLNMINMRMAKCGKKVKFPPCFPFCNRPHPSRWRGFGNGLGAGGNHDHAQNGNGLI